MLLASSGLLPAADWCCQCRTAELKSAGPAAQSPPLCATLAEQFKGTFTDAGIGGPDAGKTIDQIRASFQMGQTQVMTVAGDEYRCDKLAWCNDRQPMTSTCGSEQRPTPQAPPLCSSAVNWVSGCSARHGWQQLTSAPPSAGHGARFYS